jgi:hypothetical protein
MVAPRKGALGPGLSFTVFLLISISSQSPDGRSKSPVISPDRPSVLSMVTNWGFGNRLFQAQKFPAQTRQGLQARPTGAGNRRFDDGKGADRTIKDDRDCHRSLSFPANRSILTVRASLSASFAVGLPAGGEMSGLTAHFLFAANFATVRQLFRHKEQYPPERQLERKSMRKSPQKSMRES